MKVVSIIIITLLVGYIGYNVYQLIKEIIQKKKDKNKKEE